MKFWTFVDRKSFLLVPLGILFIVALAEAGFHGCTVRLGRASIEVVGLDGGAR